MAGKISEYATEATVAGSGDLMDITKDIGGGVKDSQKISPTNVRKHELLSVTFSAARNFNVQNAFVQEMPIEGDCTLAISNLSNGCMYNIFLKNDASPHAVTLDSSWGTLRDGFAPIGTSTANKVYLVQVVVDPTGGKTYGIESY